MLSEISGKLSFKYTYTGSTKNSIMNVLLGKADAGVTLNPVYDAEPENIKNRIRILFKSEKITSHPISCHPRVPGAVSKTLKKAVLALSKTEKGKELLKTARLPLPVEARFNRDYRYLQKVNIKKLSDWGI